MANIKPRSTIIYGDTKSSKTSQLYHIARYLIKRYKKKIRLISSDGGGWAPFEDPSPDPFFKGKSLIESGWVDAFDTSYRKNALGDFNKLSEGYWPRDDKKLGVLGEKAYFKMDERCKTTPEEWESILGYMVEGVTSISNLWLGHIASQEGGVGFKHSYQYEEDGYTFGGLQEGHYGIVQTEIRKLIVFGFNRLPIRYNIWTALVAKGKNRTGEMVYGPKAAGDAITYDIPSWFGDCLYLDIQKVEKENETVESRVGWFANHPDSETGVIYPASPRIIPELYPKLLEKYPNGYIPLGFKNGLDKYFRTLDRIKDEVRGDGDKNNTVQDKVETKE